MQFRDFRNFHEMLRETVDRHPDKTAYRWFVDKEQLVGVTWDEFYNQMKKVSKSLIALGVNKDDKVNILSNTCYRWTLTDFGTMSCGASTVGIYQSNLPKDCQYIIEHSEAVAIFAENMLQLNKLLEIRTEIPAVRKVVLFNGTYEDDDWVITYDEFLELGKDLPDEEFVKRTEVSTPDDIAGIVYTSGTTGVPKGAMLTHDNIMFTAQSVSQCGNFQDNDQTFVFLPLAHVFARTGVYAAMFVGSEAIFSRGLETLVDDFKLARPTWFISVPRIFEKIYSKVISGAEAKGGLALKIFRWSRAVGEKVSNCKLAKRQIPLLLQIQYAVAEKLVFSKLQGALGGKVRWCISGAAPLNPGIAQFFHAAGILILEGVGMTENTSFSNVNRFDNYRFGWVGMPGPGIEQKIGEDGEIMFRGRNVMKGYYKMPDETVENITEDGWLLTGDIGEIDSENFLRITGRKKELIITAGGKNIAPAAIEGVLGTSKYINQVCVIGDRRKFLSALVSLDLENVREYADSHGIGYSQPEDLVRDEEIFRLVEREVAEKNKAFPSYETIKKITIVPEFTVENAMMTPTMKLKKKVIFDNYANEIDSMYPKD